jgi:imidazolonepropionase-like amidohydrolase
VDVTGKTVLPGLMDAHVHTQVSPGPPGFSPPRDLSTDQVHALLRAGVTSYLDLGSSPADIYDKRARSGQQDFPRIFAAGPMVTATWGHPCTDGPSDACRSVDSPSEVESVLDGVLADEPDVVKGVLERGFGLGSIPTLSSATLAELAQQTRTAGVPLVMHVSRTDHMMQLVDLGVSRFAHMPYQGELTDEDVATLVREGVQVIPTLVFVDALYRLAQETFSELTDDATLYEDVDGAVVAALQDPEFVAQVTARSYRDGISASRRNVMANVARCQAAGLRLVAGTDSGNTGVFHGRALRRELALYVDAGLTPQEALRTATLNVADFLGRGDLGRLQRGALADVLVVEGDATVDIGRLNQVVAVYKGGVPVDRAALALP